MSPDKARRALPMLAAVALALAVSGAKAATTTNIPGWRLVVKDDRFTGSRRCTLSGGERGRRLSFRPGAIIFRFPDHVDTLDAWYRVDAGRAVHWRDDFPDLIAHGILPDDGPSLANPTDGRVILPVARLAGSTEVWIRPSRRAAPHLFKLGDFTAAIAQATAAGCTFSGR